MTTNRRDFMASAATWGATAALAGTLAHAATAPATVPTRLAASDRRKLGRLEVSSIGLGCMQMAGPVYGVQVERKDMVALARSAFDTGVTFFDTAEA